MDNTLFEELIKPYTIKIVNPDSGIVKYEIPRKFRYDCINLVDRSPKAAIQVKTPHGNFSSLRDATRQTGITLYMLKKLCETKNSGFSYFGRKKNGKENQI